MNPLKLIFMGTPEFAVPTLQALIDSAHEVVAVYTQPPRPSGRGHKETPSPIHSLAAQHNIDVHTPPSLKSEDVQATFKAHGADAAVVAAYGLLLPPAILEACPMGCINVHPSKLPRWRGCAPIQHTIMAGDRETAMCIMQMNEGLDTGDVLAQRNVAIDAHMTAGQLHDYMAKLAGPMILDTLEGLQTDTIAATPQSDDGATYAPKITKETAHIDWQQSAETIIHLIRGLNPHPVAWFNYKEEKIKVWDAEIMAVQHNKKPGTVLDDVLTISCAQNAIRPTLIQRPGKKPMSCEAMLCGYEIPAGEIVH